MAIEQVYDLLKKSTRLMTSIEIADKLHLSKSSVHRHLAILMRQNYVYSEPIPITPQSRVAYGVKK